MAESIIFIIVGVLTIAISTAAGYVTKKYLPVTRKNNQKEPHHIHDKKIPRAGGMILWTMMLIGSLCFITQSKSTIGILLASTILLIIGLLDDRYKLKASTQLAGQILAIIIVIASGIGITYITNPFGDFLWLNTYEFTVLTINHVGYQITLFADLLTLIWLLAMMNITNWIDGTDGVAPSIGIVASFVIFALSLKENVNQPETALMALLLGAGLIGFLYWNKPPAKLFLGTAGSMLVGFYIGILSIISGSKLATTLLVMGLPFLDAIWVIVKRFIKHRSIWKPDQSHLHHTLLRLGFSKKQIVMIIVSISTGFGFIAITVQHKEKALSFILLLAIVCVLALAITIKKKQDAKKNSR